MLSVFHMEKAVSLAVLQLDQAAPEGGIVSGRKQERGDDPGPLSAIRSGLDGEELHAGRTEPWLGGAVAQIFCPPDKESFA